MPCCPAQTVHAIVACHTGILQRGQAARRGARDALLAEAALQMDSSPDARTPSDGSPGVAVPALAEGCLLHLRRQDGPERVAATDVAARQQRAPETARRDDRDRRPYSTGAATATWPSS
ncbi:SpoIIE family protein phosphatase [Streptomyces californicus]